ncbi:MAG: MmcQ/YjbR family DNA-binding protein, partial [Vicinamibacterales bacterium]
MDRESQIMLAARERCLSLPECRETGSWGHPNFRAGKRTYVTFEWIQGRPSIAFRVGAADVERLLGRKGSFLTPYGRGQWVSLWADGRVSWKLVASLIEQSYRTVALKGMIAILDGT